MSKNIRDRILQVFQIWKQAINEWCIKSGQREFGPDVKELLHRKETDTCLFFMLLYQPSDVICDVATLVSINLPRPFRFARTHAHVHKKDGTQNVQQQTAESFFLPVSLSEKFLYLITSYLTDTSNRRSYLMKKLLPKIEY